MTRRVAAACVVAWAMVGASCGQQPERNASSAAEKSKASGPSDRRFLANMPTNSDERCVGITAVSSVLREGRPVDGGSPETVHQLARRIYRAFTGGGRLEFADRVLVDGDRLPIDSPTALNRLSTAVAGLFKDEFLQLRETDEGRQGLLRAQTRFVKNAAELQSILAADPDHTEVFFASGIRRFPDGTVKETHHAVLIGQPPGGAIVIFDPNEPARPIPCLLTVDEVGLRVEWTCKYKDTGLTTTQQYRIVPRSAYFRSALRGRDGNAPVDNNQPRESGDR